ncbi:hypothetical protein FBU30_008193 [Linnemannia zychae]|nr:hypothetical protein FBU30_008193 [Linnemannia zychae]
MWMTLLPAGTSSFLINSSNSTLFPWITQAQLQCQQFGADTFRVGSTLKFYWSNAGGEAAEPIPSFNIDLYCFESNKYMQTIATVNTSSSVSPYSWQVDQSIMNNIAQCQFNQYQGRFTWNATDPNTGALTAQSAACKTMLLVGPGVVGPGGSQQPTPDSNSPLPEDDPPIGQIEVSDKTKKIVIGVGCAVGALVLAGFFGFYYIRFKNKRAVEKSANRKLREPLDPDHARPVTGSGTATSQARYNELDSVATSVAGYSPLQPPGEMVELNGMPSSSSSVSTKSGHQGFDYRAGSPTPIASRHANSPNAALLSQPSTSFSSDRPPSLLTSSFIPPNDESSSFQSRPSGRAPQLPQPLSSPSSSSHLPSSASAGSSSRAYNHNENHDQERQLFEQQIQQQQYQQQQMHHQQQQLQQNYTGYQY